MSWSISPLFVKVSVWSTLFAKRWYKSTRYTLRWWLRPRASISIIWSLPAEAVPIFLISLEGFANIPTGSKASPLALDFKQQFERSLNRIEAQTQGCDVEPFDVIGGAGLSELRLPQRWRRMRTNFTKTAISDVAVSMFISSMRMKASSLGWIRLIRSAYERLTKLGVHVWHNLCLVRY